MKAWKKTAAAVGIIGICLLGGQAIASGYGHGAGIGTEARFSACSNDGAQWQAARGGRGSGGRGPGDGTGNGGSGPGDGSGNGAKTGNCPYSS